MASRKYEPGSGKQTQALLPLPVLAWEDVLRSLEPTKEPTRAQVRTVRSKGWLSAGVQVTHHGTRGLKGRGTYYSFLSAWAQRARRDGLDEDADLLSESAREVESKFEQRLQGFLSRHPLSDLPNAEFFDDLASCTATELGRAPKVFKFVLTAGRVAEMNDATGRVEGYSPANTETEVDLPASLLQRRHAHVGSGVWVLSRTVGDAAVVEVVPAVTAWVDAMAVAPQKWMYMGAAMEPLDEFDLAAHYADTAASKPGADYFAGLLADAKAGRLARRHLRPAG